MHLNDSDKRRIAGTFRVVKEPGHPDAPQQDDPRVAETVSHMLLEIEEHGLDAVRRYAKELDGFEDDDFAVSEREFDRAASALPADLRDAIDQGALRARRFAAMQREHLVDFEGEVVPGVTCGQRYLPVQNVGAYLPAGRFPPWPAHS